MRRLTDLQLQIVDMATKGCSRKSIMESHKKLNRPCDMDRYVAGIAWKLRLPSKISLWFLIREQIIHNLKIYNKTCDKFDDIFKEYEDNSFNASNIYNKESALKFLDEIK